MTEPTPLRPEDVTPDSPTADPARFAGQATTHYLARALGTGELRVNVLFFEAGARTRPHMHPFDQVLFYAQGVGVVAQDGGADRRIGEGEFVLLPAGHLHMHGAAPDGPAMHISIMRESSDAAGDQPVTRWDVAPPPAWHRWAG